MVLWRRTLVHLWHARGWRRLSGSSDGGYTSLAFLLLASIVAASLAMFMSVLTSFIRISESQGDVEQAYWLACGTADLAVQRLQAHATVGTVTLHSPMGDVVQSVKKTNSLETVTESAKTAHAAYAVTFAYDLQAEKVVSWQEGVSV